MKRFLAFTTALLCALVTVSSACLAQVPSVFQFTLQPDTDHSNKIKAEFKDNSRRDHDNRWSDDFNPAELIGLDVATFRNSGSHPLRFAVIRDAGRLDCLGNGGESFAHGACNFAPDPAFASLLASRGIAQPTDEERFAMMAVNVRRDVVDAIAAAGYPAPRPSDLIAMAALGVDSAYIRGLAAAGYRPARTDTLIQFKALDITPDWIRGFVRIGYAGVPADELVQLRALGISPEYISSFEAAGFRHLPVNELVQLKALGITPDFARWAAAQRGSLPSAAEMMRMRIAGSNP